MTTTTYPSVDLTLMAQSIRLMSDHASSADALFTTLNYLPALHDQFQTLTLNMNKSGQALRDTALSAKMGLEKNIKELSYFEASLTGARTAQETADTNTALANLPARVKSTLYASTDVLSRQLSSLKTPSVLNMTQGYLEESEKDLADAKAALGLLSEQEVKLQEQRQTLTAAIDVLSQGGIEKIGKDITLTLENITALGLSPTNIQAVMFAIERLKKTIEHIGESIRFLDLLQQRDRLVTKITAQQKLITLKNEHVVCFNGQIKFITTIHAMLPPLQAFVGEYQRIIEAFKLFTTRIDLDLPAEAQQFIEFLTPLSKPW